MSKLVDRTGQRFKYCTVIRQAGVDKFQNALWECLCDCGAIFIAHGYDLASGRIISCKCFPKSIKHGMASLISRKHKKIYTIWASMVQRCTNPNDRNYHNYGGRGVSVTSRWKKFDNFYLDMGDIPFKGATLDRIDNNKGYNKSNCRWVTLHDQQRNKRSNVWVTIEGETLIFSDWIRRLNICKVSVYNRMKKGMSREEAILDVYKRGSSKKSS